MMKRTITLLILTVLIVACGANKRETKVPVQQTDTAEDWVQKALENFAKTSPQCSEPMLALVKANATNTKSLISEVKSLMTEAKSVELKPDLSHLQAYAPGVDPENHLVFGVTIATSDRFLGFLDEAANLLESLASNDTAMNSISEIHGLIFKQEKPSSRIAHVLKTIASNPDALQALLEAAHVIACEDYSDAKMLSLFLAPKIFWGLGTKQFKSDLIALLRDFGNPGFNLKTSTEHMSLSAELKAFADALKKASGTPNNADICSVNNLDAYKKYFPLVIKMTQAADTGERPLVAFGNMLFKLYSMKDDNQCVGQSLSDLSKENAAGMLKQLADFMKNEDWGIKAVLLAAKPE